MGISLLPLLAIITALAFADSPKIGYGSSSASITAKNQELILAGFELGLSKYITQKRMKEILQINQDVSGLPLSARAVALDLIEKDVAMLTGFSGSHDSILASKVAAEYPVLTILAGSNHNSLREMGPYVFTTGHSMDTEVRETLEFAKERFESAPGLLIIDPRGVASASQEEIFLKVLKQDKFKKMKFNIAKLTAECKLPGEIIEELKHKKFQFILLTAYPDVSLGLGQQLETNEIDLPIIAGSSWGLGDFDVMRRFILSRKSDFFNATEWIKGSAESAQFEGLFRQKYGKDPTSEGALGYDLGSIVGQILKRVQGPISRANLIRAFEKDYCFKELSVGQICFQKGGGHSSVKVKFLRRTSSSAVRVR
jgi:ABC-type branched-subunit amino acid transport system substrate-binding protein